MKTIEIKRIVESNPKVGEKMNKYQEALDEIKQTTIDEPYELDGWTEYNYKRVFYEEDENIQLLQELVDKATILQDENVQKLLKTFIPIDEPYCSNCMFYTESNCDKKDNCYLNKFIKAIDWSKDD